MMDAKRQNIIDQETQKLYYQKINAFLVSERKVGKKVYPASERIFAAFEKTFFDDVKVVILWQDPYHGPWQAMGLSFSVPAWVPLPPSLRNIYKEIAGTTWKDLWKSGDLTHWAEQGVLLLNAILTVQAGQAASHRKIWREQFTDTIIQKLSDDREGIIFLLWGAFAQWKESLIDMSKHTVLTAPHPSPLSAHRWFFGSNHFVKVNEILSGRGEKVIEW